ncbi:expressed unknown protein [Seminavis robusta]|uniref:Uncharacterized protein n=1 Tax=Seminavis robusta TaxID=568900 RepID=A0A9N8D764_9STRA|nr:expressed unknown protein [Seminavis robusta]|eukprot:Sro5_g004590.1 n/a (801) ;mRNA; f:195621-198183
MKLPAFLLLVVAQLIWTASSSPDSLLGKKSSGGGNKKAKEAKKAPQGLHKKVVPPGKTVKQVTASSELKVVGDLTFGEPIVFPSPMFEGEEITYRIPAAEEDMALTCILSGPEDSGDADLATRYEDETEEDCSSVGVDSNEECFSLIPQGQAILVTVNAFLESSDVVLLCTARPIEELTFGEDTTLTFDTRELIGFSYAPQGLENVQCTTTVPGTGGVEGDLDLTMFNLEDLRSGEVLGRCQSSTSGTDGSDESCKFVTFPPATLHIAIVPYSDENKTAIEGDLILRCDSSPVEDVVLGVRAPNMTLAEGETASFKIEVEGPSRAYCVVSAAVDTEDKDLDLRMYSLSDLDNVCSSAGLDSLEECYVIVNETSTIIIEAFNFLGSALDDFRLRCWAGPVVELELGEPVPLVMDVGDMYTFYLSSFETPAAVVCEVTKPEAFENDDSLVIGFVFDELMDQRGTQALATGPFPIGMFYNDSFFFEVFAVSDPPQDDVSFTCTATTVATTPLTLGIPTPLAVEDGDVFFFEFEVPDGPSDVFCETVVIEGNETDVDLAMTPIVLNYTKVLSQADIFSNNTLIWPWAYAGTTFQVALQEWDSSKDIDLLCDTVPLDQLELDVPVTLSSEDLTGPRMPFFLLDASFEADFVGEGKVFYLTDVAGMDLNCSLEAASNVELDLVVSEVAADGSRSISCGSSSLYNVGCLAFLSNTTEYVFAEIIARNITGPDNEMTLSCSEAVFFDFEFGTDAPVDADAPVSFDESMLPGEDSEDGSAVDVERTGASPPGRRLGQSFSLDDFHKEGY